MRPETHSKETTTPGPQLQLDWREPMRALPHIVGRLVAQANPLKIVLFGSHAKGTAREGSDVDLLVVLDTSDNLRTSALELRSALRGVSVPVDIIVGTPELLRKYADFSGYVYQSALEEGVCVYERR